MCCRYVPYFNDEEADTAFAALRLDRCFTRNREPPARVGDAEQQQLLLALINMYGDDTPAMRAIYVAFQDLGLPLRRLQELHDRHTMHMKSVNPPRSRTSQWTITAHSLVRWCL